MQAELKVLIVSTIQVFIFCLTLKTLSVLLGPDRNTNKMRSASSMIPKDTSQRMSHGTSGATIRIHQKNELI